jgi:hypothetical protein
MTEREKESEENRFSFPWKNQQKKNKLKNYYSYMHK